MSKTVIQIKKKTIAFIVIAVILIVFVIIGIIANMSFSSREISYTQKETYKQPSQQPCDREAEARTASREAMSYCRIYPYGVYRTTVCGIPVTVECQGALVEK
jgi:flagellar basal body-associated protein FliL